MPNIVYKITDCITDFADSNQVYVEISKNDISKLFAAANETPKDDTGTINYDFSSGKLQFIFNKEDDTLQEVLAFPVYEPDKNNTVNGESFIDVYDVIHTSELL